jgi:A/G-specific adenine glycosylase
MSPAAPGIPALTRLDSPNRELLAAIQEALIAWFGEHGRDLPWRQTRVPYKILVSEVMLQQIQVARATPFYLAFLDRFPTVEDLAVAPLAEVIRVWGDLGRYRRLVNLHRTAQRIVDEFGGVFPCDVETLRTLPGVGPYTAGAVACFAFEQDVGFLDTNSRRVIHRLFVGSELPEASANDRELLELARRAVPAAQGWVWNQALIEFGALHCTARRPACATCPVQEQCRSYPGILTSLVEKRQGSDVKRSPAYEGTNRYYRGRVLAVLRDLPDDEPPAALELRALGTKLRPDFSDEELPWIYEVVQSLRKDGLAAVNEDRPAYDAGGGAMLDPGEVRVSLP